jgi:outer membrane protein OmpA-like peptidoglycan-associated protein
MSGGSHSALLPTPVGERQAVASVMAIMRNVSVPFGALRPFAYTDFGLVFTGPLLRPYFHGAVGIDFQITRAFTLGPLFGYGHVFQKDGPRYSSDARSIEFCVTLTFRPVSDEPAPRHVTYVYRDRVIQLPPPPTPPSGDLDKLLDAALPMREAPKARVELLAPVLFKFASDELEPVGVAMLHEVARELEKRQDIRLIEIEGYADNRGADAVNVELSNRRAQRVFEWLVAHGIAPERMRVAAHGESEPVESAETEEAHEQNRRVVFRVIEASDPVEQNDAVPQ